MMPYILIVLTAACGGSSCTTKLQTLTMQRFNNDKACQFASLEIKKMAFREIRAVCVPAEIVK